MFATAQQKQRCAFVFLNIVVFLYVTADGSQDTEWNRVLRKVSSETSSGPLSMHPLRADKHNEKHVPYLEPITRNGLHFRIGVRGVGGSKDERHPMLKGHHISKVWVLDAESAEVVFYQDITSQHDASATFDVSYDYRGRVLIPWSYCNLHGLWEGPAETVAEVNSGGGSDELMMEQRVGNVEL